MMHLQICALHESEISFCLAVELSSWVVGGGQSIIADSGGFRWATQGGSQAN